MKGRGIGSLMVDAGAFRSRHDSGASWLLAKEAQEQPDNVQFAQDFANLAFQFLQDRAPALMKYILGFEVVDRAENGTRAVGIFGFKIDGDYYYVPAFFLNSQVKGVNSILSKKTNSFVPLTEQWVNYIINRKANELGKEAPPGPPTDPSQFENPTLDFLQRPTVGPLGGPPYSMDTVVRKTASAEDAPWTFRQAWDAVRGDIEKRAGDDPEFKKAFAGFYLSFGGIRNPMPKEASSPVRDYLEKVAGPLAEASLMRALRDPAFANAALEFYSGPAVFHVDAYPKDNAWIRKRAEEISDNAPKVRIDSEPGSEDEAREILEDGFVVRDTREPERQSDVIETDYESSFQNPDLPGIYKVLVDGGRTVEAYVLPLDPLFASRKMAVYFPSNRQLLYAPSREILCDGGSVGSVGDIYGKAGDVSSCSLDNSYLMIGKSGTAFPEFHVCGVKREHGERPVVNGHFDFYGEHDDYRGDPDDDFTNYWAGDLFRHRDGSIRVPDVTVVGSIELAGFTGRPKWTGGTLSLPSDWKALRVGDKDNFVPVSADEADRRARERVVYRLGTIDSLSLALRKEGAAKLEVRSDDGIDYHVGFDGNRYTPPMGYKEACVALVTRLGLRPADAKRLLKRAAVERSARCLVKMGQLVGVQTRLPPEQTPEVDPYTGIPVYGSPYYDASEMPFYGNDPTVSEDNQPGENIGGDIQRQSEEGGAGAGAGGQQEAEFDPGAAQLAQDAAKLGQKDVFDKAAIGGLAKVYDTGAVIDSYLPEFMQALDRVGRVMFLYYWRHNDFTARYGTDDVVEMEDVLKNVFNNLGKLTLDLKSKAVGGGDAQGDADIV